MRAAVVALVSLLSLAMVRADPPRPNQNDMEHAHAAYVEGEAAYRLGHFGEAAQKYEEAYRVIHFPTILFDTAQAQRRWYETDRNLEHLRRALDLYRAFLRDAPTARERSVVQKFVPEGEAILATEMRRQREGLIARATGLDAVFLADQLVAEGLPVDAALALDHLFNSHGNPREAMVGAFERRALLAGLLGRPEEAFELCKRAFALDPGFVVPESASPAAREACNRALVWHAGKLPLTLRHVAPGEVKRGLPVRIEITVESDPVAMVESVAVMYRRTGGGAYLVARAPKAAGMVEVPAAFFAGMAGGTKVEYYAAALDSRDDELAIRGTAREPFVLTIAVSPEELQAAMQRNAPPEKPLFRRAWFWGTLGGALALVVGGAIVLNVALSGPTPSDGTIVYPGN